MNLEQIVVNKTITITFNEYELLKLKQLLNRDLAFSSDFASQLNDFLEKVLKQEVY